MHANAFFALQVMLYSMLGFLANESLSRPVS